MNILTTEIENDKIGLLRLRDEGHFFDFKSKAILPKKLSCTVCAFANADGGEIYVGIEDPIKGWKWDGFDNPEAGNGIIQTLDGIFPLGDGIQYEFLTNNSNPGFVLRIEIQKSAEIKKATNGKIYLRRGAQNLPIITDVEIERLKLNKGLKSYEDSTIQSDVSEIEN